MNFSYINMYFCLKIYKKKQLNYLYKHIKKDFKTHNPTANFYNGLFLDVRKTFLNKITRFY